MQTDMKEEEQFEFRSPHGIRKIESRRRSWNGIAVRHIVHYLEPGKVWHDLSSHETTIAIVLDQVGGYCEPRENLNRPTPRSRFDAGHATFAPADMTVWGYSDGIRSVRELRMSFAPKVLESILGEELDTSKVDRPTLLLYDDSVAKCAALLANECQDPLGHSQLFGEGLTTALLAGLFTTRKTSAPPTNGLSRWQLRLSMEYLEAHMMQGICLEEMAELAKLSQSQFARLFKVSTGMSPYKWALDARIKRAQELLLLGKDSITSIAIQTGFADQSHFTKMFRRTTAMTPKDWQQSRRL
ncbi:AraC family transcriptional regulator [Undibacterium sp.]|jgi:AraC family transcriptional regulator|uniref:AraC family transcriptional regulator n=1 Tax=Undibacterium sp. TaxID=1914977 RepID=UPI002CF620AA|nr:AraC family transcriptional regulator [Undibacterium sp.]HTD06958.1 AraC family transcriptional regulator [Undibacterium sp.]